MEDPAVVCFENGVVGKGGMMVAPMAGGDLHNSRSSSPGQHTPFDATKMHEPVIMDQGYYPPPQQYAPYQPQNIVYDAAGIAYVPYIPPPQVVPPQMVRCYPVVQVNHHQPPTTYRSAGEPRQVQRPQGYCSAGEPGRAATLRMVAPGNPPPQQRGTSARVLTELSPAEVRTALTSGRAPGGPQQQQGVVGVATMVGAVPHAARNGTRYHPLSGPQYIQLPAGQLRPMAYASDPNMGARVLLSGARRGHSAGSRVVLHDSFATVSDAPDGATSPNVVLSSAASGSFSQSGDNRPTVAAANPYVCAPARRPVPNPFAAHAGVSVGPTRLGSGVSLTSSQSHVLGDGASSVISEPSSSPTAPVPPMVSLLRAAASHPLRGDSDDVMAMHRLQHHPKDNTKHTPDDELRQAAAATVPAKPDVWASDSSENGPSKELNADVKPPAPTYVLGKNNVPKPAPAHKRTAGKSGGFLCCGSASSVRE